MKTALLLLAVMPSVFAQQTSSSGTAPTMASASAAINPDCAYSLIASIEPDFAASGNPTSYTLLGRFPKGCQLTFGGKVVPNDAKTADEENQLIFTATPDDGPNNVQLGGSNIHVVNGEAASIATSTCPGLPRILIQHRARRAVKTNNYCNISPSGEQGLVIDASDTLETRYYPRIPDKLSCAQVPYHNESQPLALKAHSTLRVFVCNKNPFTTNYKLTVTGAPIPEDDLSTFLGALVPGLGASAAADTATKAAQSQQSKAASKALSEGPVPLLDCTLPIRNRIAQLDNDYVTFFRFYNDIRSELVTDNKCENLSALSQLLYTYANDEVDSLASVDLENFIGNYLAQMDLSHATAANKAPGGASDDKPAKDNPADTPTKQPHAGNPAKSPTDDTAFQALRGSVVQYQCIARQFHQVGDDVMSGVVTPLEGVLGAGADAFRSRTLVLNENPDGPQQVTWKLVAGTAKPIPQLKTSAIVSQIQSCLTSPKPPGSPSDNQKPPASSDRGNVGTRVKQASWANQHVTVRPTDLIYTVGNPRPPTAIKPWSDQYNYEIGEASEVSIRYYEHVTDADIHGPEQSNTPQNPSTSKPADNKGNQPTSTNNPSDGSAGKDTSGTTQPQTNSEEVKTGGKINFGKARFIVSAGVAYAHLSTVQFQKGVGQALDSNGAPVPGQQAVGIVAFQTNSSFRISPLILANARLPIAYKDTSAFFTVGVTAKNDNQGTSAEYLFGLSLPYAQDHIFATLGAYIGQKQKLNGLFVGEAIPSTLTGDIPVEKNYAVGFGASISFRIPKLSK